MMFPKGVYVRDKTKINAEIHVLMGGDSDKLVDGAGKIIFVVLGGALAQGIEEDDVDVRIVRGASEAMYEQAENPVIDEMRRKSLISGLWACNRLLERIDRQHIKSTAFLLAARLKLGHIRYSDFPMSTLKATS
jgi:hypothetical protein